MSVARVTFINVLKKCLIGNQKELFLNGNHPYLFRLTRNFSTVPLEYNDRDPAPLFFSPNVQKLLKYVTRPDPQKVFRKRNNKGDEKLETPKYKFMTDDELREELRLAEIKAGQLLQIPPVVKVFHKTEPELINIEPTLEGHDNSTFIFTDITYGLKKSERFITVRYPDGSLYHADHDTRKKCLQIYFPMEGRTLLEPAMFTDETLFNDLLNKKEYEFILDRACLQYEPDESTFQKITSKVYLHIDENKAYDNLRSTRHFGSMSFFFAWNNIIDNLLLDMLQNSYIREVITLINLQRTLHPNLVADDDSKPLTEEILKLQRKITDQSKFVETEADIALDEKCVVCVENYIQKNSTRKALQELSLQAYKDIMKTKLSLHKEIKAAHGFQ